MTLITDHKWKPFKYDYEVPKSVLKEFKENYDEFGPYIKYRKTWYHLSEFMSVHNKIHNPNPPEWLIPWDGYITDTFFSCTVIKLSDDGDMYKIGMIYN